MLCVTELNDDPFQFYRNFDDTYQNVFDVSVRLTEYSVTVESIFLRFYLYIINYPAHACVTRGMLSMLVSICTYILCMYECDPKNV